jgi:hypothetical protein
MGHTTVQGSIAMNQETDVRTHVILPRAILDSIDRLVGPRGRSRFLAAAAEREIAHRELLALAEQAAGSGRDLDRPWGSTADSAAAWLQQIRGEDDDRDEQVEAFGTQAASSS